MSMVLIIMGRHKYGAILLGSHTKCKLIYVSTRTIRPSICPCQHCYLITVIDILEAGFAIVDFIDTGFKAYFDIPLNLHGNLYAPV